MKSVIVKIPATAANLGPGYDCLGIALQVYNHVEIHPGTSRVRHKMVAEAADAFFRESGVRRIDFHWHIHGDVPQSRGLGSSVTLRAGVLAGLNLATGRPLDEHQIYMLCAKLEGHPDNAAPAQFGGFVVALPDGQYCRFEVEDALKFVLLVPDFEILTDMARAVLPATVRHEDAASNAAHASMLTAAFANRDYELLRGAFTDRIHQPYRKSLMPEMEAIIANGIEAGAYGGFLSGSGSTVACVTMHHAERIAEAMTAALPDSDSKVMIVSCDNIGVCCRELTDHTG